MAKTSKNRFVALGSLITLGVVILFIFIAMATLYWAQRGGLHVGLFEAEIKGDGGSAKSKYEDSSTDLYKGGRACFALLFIGKQSIQIKI